MRAPFRCRFTLIELLVVVAIIALLASLLLPSLSHARSMAKLSACTNKLKQIGTACSMYSGEWDGYFLDGSPTPLLAPNAQPYQQHCWMRKVADYVSMDNPNYYRPSQDKKHFFLCPEDNIAGNYSSYQINQFIASIGSPGIFKADSPKKMDSVELPTAKVYFGGGTMNMAYYHGYFYPSYLPTGQITQRHPNERDNFLFVDLHVTAYTAPPLPSSRNISLAIDWLFDGYPAAPGL